MTAAATTTPARVERAVLADVLEQAGPDAPTLCEGWTTRDLAAHVVARDRRLDTLPAYVLPPLKAYAERVRRGLAGRPYGELLGLVREGAPPWAPFGFPPTENQANAMEMFIHAEDVRRAKTTWVPRDVDPALTRFLWAALKRLAKPMFRRATVGVVLLRPDGRDIRTNDHPRVTVTGPVTELVLFSYGRGSHAEVEVTGSPEDVAALRSVHLGIS